jgi:hypothetical protein
MATITTYEEGSEDITMREFDMETGEQLREWAFGRVLAQRMKDQFPEAIEHAQLAKHLLALQASPRQSRVITALTNAMKSVRASLNPFWRWW